MSKLAPIRATLRPLDLAQHLVEVELVLPAEALREGGVAAMAAWTPGSYLVRDYARFVDRVRRQDGRREQPLEKLDKQRWQLSASKGDLTLRYRVYGNDLTVRTNHVDATHAQIIPAATFLYLEGQPDRPYEVRFEGFPADWKVASSLPQKQGACLAADLDTLIDSPFELGSFRSRRFKSGGTTFELAFTGDHNGDEGRITTATQKIVEAAGAIFGGFPFKRYVFLFTFTPRLRGGLEHKDCTSLIADSHAFDKPEGYYSLYQLAAHEFFHAWNVKRLHDTVLGPFDYSQENPTKMLWFHEGLTSYMEHLIVLRAGVVPWSHTSKELARCWSEQTQRPGRLEQSLEESSWDAWIRLYKAHEFSPNSSISYYDKGEMVAWLMDAALREGSRGKAGLPELFRLLWTRHGENGLCDGDVRKAFQELSGKAPEPFWSAYISGRAELDGALLTRAFGIKLEAQAAWEKLSPEDREDPAAVRRAKAWTGLVVAPQGASVLNVIPGSPAAAAGLSYGMEILAVDGWRTTSSSDVQRGLAEPGPGGQVQVLAADRGRVFETTVDVAESPERSYRLVPEVRASLGQRSAFAASYGQPWPGPLKRGGRR
ncbi:M61 family metallopeptidase [Geothrix sp. PMB-07]|uniref:M61 family metallopeptidase n=1 Tax=Geothrix sp. PMB-07 TaxID=3068640 RepID=UPI0027422534|nr:PDZ domain-containing protein [Geothrix sp. PMB-07]WLT30280.1 PDZ domain-containing protein [Geothrix sp. PMB-07]